MSNELIILLIIVIFTLFVVLLVLWLKLRKISREDRLKAEKLKGTVAALEETVAKLRQSQKALLQTSKVKEKLISLVIHDLRSPLRFLSFLASDLHDRNVEFSPSELKERLYLIKKGTNDVYNFSQDFLLWVTSQKNNFKITNQLFHIKPLFQELYDFFGDQVREKGNSLFCEADDALQIYSDPHILITIIRNLVDNANKYTEEGSIVISACDQEADIVISVSDTGQGMNPQQLEAFLNSDNLENVNSGTQLGHRFIFDLTRRINGAVAVDSRENEGTTIRLTFGKTVLPD